MVIIKQMQFWGFFLETANRLKRKIGVESVNSAQIQHCNGAWTSFQQMIKKVLNL